MTNPHTLIGAEPPATHPVHLLRDNLRHNREELLYLAAEPLRAPAIIAQRIRLRLNRQKSVAYIGRLGHRHLGGEAMFQVIRKMLPQFQMAPFAPPAAEATLATIGLSGPASFHGVLLGGGTLIHPYFLRAARLATSFQTPLYTVGTGVGSAGLGMDRQPSLDGWKAVLRDSLVSVRGPLSLRSLQDAGVGHACVIGDPALGLTPDTPPLLRRRNRLVINLTQDPGAPHFTSNPKIVDQLAAIVRKFITDGGEVIGVALGNGDRAALSTFRIQSQFEAMTIRDHRTSAAGILKTLAGSVALIGTRLHAAVLASCVGVPSLLFAYQPKCEDFMSSMELSDFAIPLSGDPAATMLSDRWAQLLSDPGLGRRIHQKSLFWKAQQVQFYRQITEHMGNRK